MVRDDLVYAVANVVDQNYYRYRESLLTEQAWTQTAVDTIIIGLGSAGALTGGAELKSILAAASAGVSGTHFSYVKNFFNNVSPTVVVARMDASRTSKWSTIYAKLVAPDDGSAKAYSLPEAAHDLIDYYYAGTVVTAYQDINAESGAAQKTANDQLSAEIIAKYGVPQVAAEDQAQESTLQGLINGLQQTSPTLGDSKGDKPKVIASANLNAICIAILKAYDPSITLTAAEQNDGVTTLSGYASEVSSKTDTTKFLAAFDSVYAKN